jgi:hypothetical protein
VRGLTPAEREVLLAWAPGYMLTPEETERQRGIRLTLERDGRIRRTGTTPYGGTLWKRTDLGHLALRVCPVDE